MVHFYESLIQVIRVWTGPLFTFFWSDMHGIQHSCYKSYLTLIYAMLIVLKSNISEVMNDL